MFKKLRIFLLLTLLQMLGAYPISAQEVTVDDTISLDPPQGNQIASENAQGYNGVSLTVLPAPSRQLYANEGYTHVISFLFYNNTSFGNGTWLNKKFSFTLYSSEEQSVTADINGSVVSYVVSSSGTEISVPEGGLTKNAIYVYVQYPDKITKVDFADNAKYGYATNSGLWLFGDLAGLEELNGAHSGLSVFSDANATLANCKRIFLQNNELTKFEFKSTTLEYLDLSNNDIYENNLNLTECVGALKYLNLSRNRLSKFTNQYIGTFANIEHLDISLNRVEQLNLTQFGNLSNLKYLNISAQASHKLKYVRWPESLSNMQTLKCEGNSLYFNMLLLP